MGHNILLVSCFLASPAPVPIATPNLLDFDFVLVGQLFDEIFDLHLVYTRRRGQSALEVFQRVTCS